MACETPQDCGECDGCKRASDEHEKKLDFIQTLIEDHIKAMRESIGIDDLDFKDYVSYLSASIVNSLDGYWNIEVIPCASGTPVTCT